MEAQGGVALPINLPASRIDVVMAEIREAILTRRFKPGEPLVEADLARSFGVSKTPVREALKTLASSGLVTFVPYKGASVTAVDERFIGDVYDLRLLLEPEGVRRSTVNADAASLESAASLLDDAHAAGESGDWARLSMLNRRFHEALYAHCGNRLLIEVLDNLRDRAALVSVVGWEAAPTWRLELSEHRRVLEAVELRDADAAAGMVEAHLKGFLERVLSSLREGAQ